MLGNIRFQATRRGSRSMMTIGGLALVGALLLAGCASIGSTGPGGGPGIAELSGDWQLVRAVDADGQFEVGDAKVTLTIDPEGNGGPTAGGTAACNSYGAKLAIHGGGVQFSEIFQTEMACVDDRLMQLESRYLQALSVVHSAEVGDEVLVLAGDSVELEFEPVPPVPESELLDTTWRLESLIEGSGDDGSASSVRGEYTLVLRSDGTFSAEGGCPPYEGKFTIGAGQVNVTDSGIAGDVACLAYDPVQEHVIQVLESFEVQVEGDRLTVTEVRGELGLVYRAAE